VTPTCETTTENFSVIPNIAAPENKSYIIGKP